MSAPFPRLCRPPRHLVPAPVPPPTTLPSTDSLRASDPSSPPPPPTAGPPYCEGRDELPHNPPLSIQVCRTPPPGHVGRCRPPTAPYGALSTVALAGYTTPLNPTLRVGALNTNGLTQTKLTELLWYMRLVDIFFLLDTRATQRAGKFLGRQARSFLGPGQCSAGQSPSRQALVGGQLLLIGPRRGCALKSSHKDPTGLGVLTEALGGISFYWRLARSRRQ